MGQLDYDLVDYVGQLREGILEAYTGIVTGLKKTPQGYFAHCSSSSPQSFFSNKLFPVSLLLPHAPSIFELLHRCLNDEERTDALMRLCYGLIGDLADCFPSGQLKQLLLANWVAAELRARNRMPEETKKTMRWAREVGAPA